MKPQEFADAMNGAIFLILAFSACSAAIGATVWIWRAALVACQ